MPRASRTPRRTLLLALAVLAATSAARAETFVFTDPARAQVRGKVLVEFQDQLLVAIDGGATRFIARNELEAVIDEAGGRWTNPPPGTFARVEVGHGGQAIGETPVAACTDASGEVSLRRASGADDAPAASEGPLLLRAGDAVVTGDEDGLCCVVLPSGATAKLGPAGDVTVPAPLASVERLALGRGEALIATSLRPLSVGLLPAPHEATIGLGGGSRASVVHDAGGEGSRPSGRVVCHDGTTEVTWADGRVVLEPGAGLSIARVEGGWRLGADRANAGPIDVRRKEGVQRLEPGASLLFSDAELTAGDPEQWRILRAKGELLLARDGGPFALLPLAQRYDVVLGAADSLRTAPDGEAALTRGDGAQITLAAASRQVFGQTLRLEAGRLLAEGGEVAIAIDTPGGVALVRNATLELERVGPEVMDAAAKGGQPELPLGPGAFVRMQPGAKVRVTLDPLAPEEDGRVSCEVVAGEAVVLSRPLGPGEVDPGFQVAMARGQSVAVSLVGPGDIAPVHTQEEVASTSPPAGDRAAARPPRDGVQEVDERLGTPIGGPAPRWVALHLAGERALVFLGGGNAAVVDLARSEVALQDGSRLGLVERLWLGLDRDADRPLLRFRKGPRLRLDAPLTAMVHNPTLDLVVHAGAGAGEPLATVELHGAIDARLSDGTTFAAAALGARRDDRFEVPRGARVVLDRQAASEQLGVGHGGQSMALTRFALGDGRRVWVEDGAPPVHSRLVDALGRLFLTMPGTPPLGLSSLRSVTVLATRAGEFVILSDDALDVERRGLELLSDTPDVESIARDRARDLLDVPPEDSPSGP